MLRDVRPDFPFLRVRHPYGSPIRYFDNAATTQKPQQVIDAINNYYTSSNANIHRGIHYLANKATVAYEEVRKKTGDFLNAGDAGQIIFTSGTTESINLVANSFVRQFLQPGQNVVISQLEHHSNFVPWQQLCREKDAELRIIRLKSEGVIDVDHLESLLDENTRFVAISHISNTLGTIQPVKGIVELAHRKDIPVLVDGAQAVSCIMVDLQDLQADFYCFSGHKIFGPTGVGVLYANQKYLDQMDPWKYGGEMIRSVSNQASSFKKAPAKFEAGTPNIAGVIGLGAALDYMSQFDVVDVLSHSRALVEHSIELFKKFQGINLLAGSAQTGILSFTMDHVHPHDIATIFDSCGIAIRAGHHCTEPLLRSLGITGTARLSYSIYNTVEEVECIHEGFEKINQVFLK